MKIAIVNQPMGNRGDESAHRAFTRRLCQRFPNIQFDIIETIENQKMIETFKVNEPNVGYITLLGNKKDFMRAEQVGLVLHNAKLARLHPYVNNLAKELKNYDAVICAPGGICMGGFMNWNHVYQLHLAKQMKKPVLYWGRSIGPFTTEDFKHKVFTKAADEILHYFSFISLRDKKSLKIAEEMGVKAVSTVDSAFLEVPNANVSEEIAKAIGDGKYMVFVPNSLTWHYRYKPLPQERIDSFYYKVFGKIIENHPDWKIVMLPQTYMSIIEDWDYFMKLKENYCKSHTDCNDKIIVVDENQSSDIQQTIISKAELVIGARYHSIVFALNNSRPFVSLCYEHKMSGLLETLGLTEYMVDISDIFDDGNEEKLDRAVEMAGEKIKTARSRPEETKKAKEIVDAAFEQMCGVIEKL